MKPLLFITGNKNKFEEAKLIIPELDQAEVDLEEIQETDLHKVIEHKLKAAESKLVDQNFLVEDTGLYLECLNGFPGPLIKWFMGSLGLEKIYEIAKAFDNYKCHAVTVIGLRYNGENFFFEGRGDGTIVFPKGDNKFGWNSIFKPEGSDNTFAEMTIEEKSEFSMRRKAFDKLNEFLTRQDS